MKRKRFIKLLMAKGHDRNGAVAIADYVVSTGKSYAHFYNHFGRFECNFSDALQALVTAVQRIEDAITPYIRALAKGVAAFSAAVSAELAVHSNSFEGRAVMIQQQTGAQIGHNEEENYVQSQ